MPCRTVLWNLAPACLLPTRGLLAQYQLLPVGAQCQPEGSDWYARGMEGGRDQCNAHYEQCSRPSQAGLRAHKPGGYHMCVCPPSRRLGLGRQNSVLVG